MTEPLHGLEGLRAALECQEEWEGRLPGGEWRAEDWRHWSAYFVTNHSCEFRRIEKPREARAHTITTKTCGHHIGGLVTYCQEIELANWPVGLPISVTIREIIPGALEESDWWKARYEQEHGVALAERAAHEETKATKTRQLMAVNDRYLEALSRTEMTETKLSELHAAALKTANFEDITLGELRAVVTRCAPESKTDG